MVNNLAGFLTSTLYCGIALIHFPTSLLSQVDVAIDFNQAINFDHGKNLGAAISIGMCVSTEAALLFGLSDIETLELYYDVICRICLPTTVPHALSLSDLWEKSVTTRTSLAARTTCVWCVLQA